MPARSRPKQRSSDRKKVGRRPNTNTTKRSNHRNPDDDLPALRRHAYKENEMARLLRRNAKIPFLDKISLAEKAEIQRGLPENSMQGQRRVEEAEAFLNFFFNVLDKAYFFGTISNVNRWNLVIQRDPSSSTSVSGFAPDKKEIIMILNHQGPRRASVWEGYISSLAHEMLHAFLYIHGCICQRCRKEGRTTTGDAKSTDHTAAWCNAMISIQDSLIKGTGWNIDCGLQAAVENEMRLTGRMPRPDQLHRWGVRVEQLETDPASESEEEISGDEGGDVDQGGDVNEGGDVDEGVDGDDSDEDNGRYVEIRCCTAM